MRRILLLLLALLLLAPAAAADHCLLSVAGQVGEDVSNLQDNYPNCPGWPFGQPKDCYCPWPSPVPDVWCFDE